MTSSEKLQLQKTACKVRMGVINAVHGAKAGHPGGSLSATDMFTYLYFKEMNVDPKNPKWEDRDRFLCTTINILKWIYIHSPQPLQFAKLNFVKKTNNLKFQVL